MTPKLPNPETRLQQHIDAVSRLGRLRRFLYIAANKSEIEELIFAHRLKVRRWGQYTTESETDKGTAE